VVNEGRREIDMTWLKSLVFGALGAVLVTAALDAGAKAAPEKQQPCYTLTESCGVGGLWVQHRGGPGAMLASQNLGGNKAAFLALEAGPEGSGGCQFAISANADGTCGFQIRDRDGKLHWLPVEALLKLEEKK
jgi:hypothetical protein